MAATRRPANAGHASARAASRRSTIATPLTEVKITQVYVSSAASAASSGSHEGGGAMTIAGASRTRAPAASRSCVKRCAWAAARVTTMVRPSSGRSSVGWTRAIIVAGSASPARAVGGLT